MTHTHIEKWNKGRLWLWDLFRAEWAAPTSLCMLEIDLFDGDSDRDIRFTVACWIFYFTFAIEAVLPRSWVPKCDWKTSFGESRSIGISYHDAALWIKFWHDDGGGSSNEPWYRAGLVFDIPWRQEWVRTSQLMKDGITWEHETPGNRKEFYSDEWKGKKWLEQYPYTYTLKSGDVQNVTVTVGVSEREWRPKWFKWTSLFAGKSKTIEVEFDSEVGEGIHSWKGGTISCGYNLLPNETPLECLRRMESERVFR